MLWRQMWRWVMAITRKRWLGWLGEGIALVALMLRGYLPVSWGRKAGGAEIDLIVRRGPDLVLVEVKTRRTWAGAEMALGHKQLARQNLARERLQARYVGHEVKLGVVYVVGAWPLVRIII